MITTEERRKIGKRNKINGAIFERKVRKDLEAKGWIVDRWTNNIELTINTKSPTFAFEKDKEGVKVSMTEYERMEGKCSFAKTNRFNMRTTGFPDFIALTRVDSNATYPVNKALSGVRCWIFIECKTNGTLNKIEKEKARWYLDNNYCSKFLIAYKTMENGRIVINYKEFK